MPAVLVIILGILVIGTVAAIWWWNISARASPYADEAARHRARREAAEREARENTVVIQPPAAPTERPPRRAG